MFMKTVALFPYFSHFGHPCPMSEMLSKFIKMVWIPPKFGGTGVIFLMTLKNKLPKKYIEYIKLGPPLHLYITVLS